MFALKLGRVATGGARNRMLSAVALRETIVLPRLLRRTARLMKRINDGEVAAPRFGATIMTAAFLGATSIYGAYLGGHVPAYAQAVTARTGFAVDEVRVVGHRETSEIDILDQLGLDGWTSLIGFNAETARDRVAALPWVQVASVRKVYPDEIEVQVTERDPFAIWQHDNELSVVDKGGRIIAPYSGGHLARLPQVIGAGAAAEAEAFFEEIAGHPELAARIKAYVRVANRRWDLKLNNGVIIKLPERDPEAAIVTLLGLDASGRLLSRDISSVDLRIADRAVVQLTASGLESRTAELEAQAKARKKAGKA